MTEPVKCLEVKQHKVNINQVAVKYINSSNKVKFDSEEIHMLFLHYFVLF